LTVKRVAGAKGRKKEPLRKPAEKKRMYRKIRAVVATSRCVRKQGE